MAHATSVGRLLATVALLLALAAGRLPAETASVNLLLDPPTADVNTLDVTVTAQYGIITRNASDTTEVTGNALATLTYGLDPMSCEVDVTGLEFTGGRVAMSNLAFTLNYGLFVGKIEATGTGIAGTLDTPAPPGSVAAGVFPTEQHEIILNEGTFHAVGTGLLIPLVFDPVTIDLAAEPMNATTVGDGFLTVSPPALVDHTATYDVTLSLPVDFQEHVMDDPSITVDVAGVGLLQAQGSFSTVVPDPPLPVWTGGADNRWDKGENWTSVLPPGHGSTAIFDAAATHQPALHQGEGVAGIEFRTTGWAVTGNFALTVGAAGIASAGGGMNTLAADVVLADALEINVAELGTLVLEGLLDNAGGHTVTKTGDGLLVIDGPQDHAPGAAFHVLDGAVQMNSAAGAAGNADLCILVAGDAVLEFGADQYLDTLTLTDTAVVRLSGAGVVVVKNLVMNGVPLGAMTLTPEPATLALLALGALGLAMRRPVKAAPAGSRIAATPPRPAGSAGNE